MSAADDKPYGYTVVFERAKPNGGLAIQTEQVTIRRKGSEAGARKAASMTSGFREIISITPISQADAPAPRQRRTASVGGAQMAPGLPIAHSESEIDAAADGIRAIRAASAQLAVLASQRRKLLEQIENLIPVVSLVVGEKKEVTDDLKKVLARCERLRGLINMEEFESWQITVDHAMVAAWRALP